MSTTSNLGSGLMVYIILIIGNKVIYRTLFLFTGNIGMCEIDSEIVDYFISLRKEMLVPLFHWLDISPRFERVDQDVSRAMELFRRAPKSVM